MAPFVALGHPYGGHWLAARSVRVLVFWIARELAGDAAKLIAGLLTALSPGMALFSNLLLAHHPTLVGSGVFILGALRLLRNGSLAWGLASGAGLAFAMLCRPMTAAGVALPFGLYFAWWALKAKAAPLILPSQGGQGVG
jgi:4-amino-4-deoxy-L-arabinose transferase-like glycosyltransferase